MYDQVTVLILTKNSAATLPATLDSISKFKYVVVLDSYSTDDTVQIAKKYRCQVVQKKFENYASQRKKGISLCKTDWVFMLDSDEQITPELELEMNALILGGEFKAMDIPRKNFLLGKWIQYSGWYPDYQTRLLKLKTLLMLKSRSMSVFRSMVISSNFRKIPMLIFYITRTRIWQTM